MPDNKLMKAFMKRHYARTKYIVMKGWAEHEIVKHLKQTSEHAPVVMGLTEGGQIAGNFGKAWPIN